MAAFWNVNKLFCVAGLVGVAHAAPTVVTELTAAWDDTPLLFDAA